MLQTILAVADIVAMVSMNVTGKILITEDEKASGRAVNNPIAKSKQVKDVKYIRVGVLKCLAR